MQSSVPAPEACPICGGNETVRDSDDYVFCYACQDVAPLPAPSWWFSPGAYCRLVRHRPEETVRRPALMGWSSHAPASRRSAGSSGSPVSPFLGRRPVPAIVGEAPRARSDAGAPPPRRRSPSL